MTDRAIYIWKLDSVVAAESSVNKVIERAVRAQIKSLWIKIADGKTPYANVRGSTRSTFLKLVERAGAKNMKVWGWHVPHCAIASDVPKEVATVEAILNDFALDGLIMDAEGGDAFFQGNQDDADAYGEAMRRLANSKRIPLAISSNDIPRNLTGWLPKFNKIASHATINFPQVYYGSSPSVVSRLDRSANANTHLTIPFAPVGAAWIGDGGGCVSIGVEL